MRPVTPCHGRQPRGRRPSPPACAGGRRRTSARMQPMARIGCRPPLALAFVAAAAATLAAEPAADPQSAVTATLAVQDAMRQAREGLQAGRPKAAVDAL